MDRIAFVNQDIMAKDPIDQSMEEKMFEDETLEYLLEWCVNGAT